MARPANRKEWLELFLELTDRNRPAREFRLKLGIKLPELGENIQNISQIRRELAEINVAETKIKKKKKKLLIVPASGYYGWKDGYKV